jgi:hypothetical protein
LTKLERLSIPEQVPNVVAFIFGDQGHFDSSRASVDICAEGISSAQSAPTMTERQKTGVFFIENVPGFILLWMMSFWEPRA